MTPVVVFTLDIRYDCRGCGLVDVIVHVPARASNEDVVWWVEEIVTPTVSEDHQQRSPQCMCDVFDLKIPAPKDADYIGQPRKN